MAACEEAFDGDAKGTQVSLSSRSGCDGSGGRSGKGEHRVDVMPPFLCGVAASMVERMDAKPS